ncbi:hypothetical protein SAMN05216474_0561 [Lishizhenia tianjinensis]|uniref:Uncharacterized protein n=1 Tax=Lishizhenia tianjinensis TaxID=477690 RepID=A0A1I6Y064_9FLAO|nr:DUF6584 family protein [Lishizhenia tianjinensis]SFT43712.1 hypothetical protein SAMN05216474_0561 [Lishizhenia tianjinensis]
MNSLDHKIVKKIELILIEESTEVAIERIQGYMEHYFWSDWIREKLGGLYYKVGNYPLAGRYWYFKEDLNSEEEKCINLYTESKGKNLIDIAREQIGHEFKSPRNLSEAFKNGLWSVLTEIQKTNGQVPDFAKNWYAFIKKEKQLQTKNKQH